MTPTLFEPQLDREFREFHDANPQVFEVFTRLALDAMDAGQRVGARCIWERMRWYYRIEIAGNAKPKLNDHHAPRYARLLARIDPRFKDFFEFRRTG